MYIDWDDNYNHLNWFKPSEPPQLLPKDILKGSRMISGEEAERHILNAITKPYRLTGPSMDAIMGSTSSSMWGISTVMEREALRFGVQSQMMQPPDP